MRYVYCHPLFDERKCAHRFSYELAKTFERNNLQLERFDYRGTGEADGQFCDVTKDRLQADIQAIINSDQACLVGTRFGATVAFDCCCLSESAVQTLVLIEPIVNGQGYAEYLFRKQHLKNMMTGNQSEFAEEDAFCNLEGYKTSNLFIEQIKQIQLVETAEKIQSGTIVYIIQTSASSKIKSEYALLADYLKKSGIQTFIEIFNLPVFWERIPDGDYSVVTKKIVEWCR